MRFGLDVGGTKTDAVAVAPDGTIVGRLRRPTGWGADAVVATIADAVEVLAAEVGVAVSDIASVGIGIPGQVVPGTARVRNAVNLGVAELDLGERVGALHHVPIVAENDVKAAALGASTLHGAVGATIGYLNVGTGVAAGIVRDGLLWRGAHGTAGEVGHISVDPAGPECRCGQRGCVEALAGGGPVGTRWGRGGGLPVVDLFDAADAGDPRAVQLRDGLAFGIAAAVRLLVLTVDMDAIMIGGGVTGLRERLLSPVVTQLRASASSSAFLRSLELADRISLLPAGSPAAAFGAALLQPADAAAEHDNRKADVRG